MLNISRTLAVFASVLTLNAANVTLLNNLGSPVESFDYIDPDVAPSNADVCPCYASFSTGSVSASLTDVVLELQLVGESTAVSIQNANSRKLHRGTVSRGAAQRTFAVKTTLAPAGSITVALYSNAGGNPGSLIGPIGTLSDSALTASPAQYDFPLSSPIPLAAHTRYWVGVTTSTTSQGGWDWSSSGAGTEISSEFFWVDGGPAIANGTNPYIMQVNVSENAAPSPTPAPASLLLMLTAVGLGGLYLARRRFSKAAGRRS